jgi:hypothetical protein
MANLMGKVIFVEIEVRELLDKGGRHTSFI